MDGAALRVPGDCGATGPFSHVTPILRPDGNLQLPHLEMDRTLPEYDAITVPVPEVRLVTEEKFKDYSFEDISHVVFRSV